MLSLASVGQRPVHLIKRIYTENDIHSIRMAENHFSLTFDEMIYRNKAHIQEKARSAIYRRSSARWRPRLPHLWSDDMLSLASVGQRPVHLIKRVYTENNTHSISNGGEHSLSHV